MYPVTDKTVFTRRADGSFVLDGLIHVPNEDEWAAQWADLNARYLVHPELFREETAAEPEPTLEEAKAAKLAEIKAVFSSAEAEGYVESSLGFRADATRRSIEDIDGLIDLVSSGALAAPVTFRDYDDAYHPLTLDQLNALRLEAKGRGPLLYAKKWALEAAVDAAETVEAVCAVEVKTGWPGVEA